MRKRDSAAAIGESYERQRQRWVDDKYRTSHPGNLRSDLERERVWIALLARYGLLPLDGKRILDVGCGEGKLLMRFHYFGALLPDMVGIDIIPRNIENGQKRCPGVDLRLGDAAQMEFPDGSFDLVMTSMAFSSMPTQTMREAAAREMVRVLRPGGGILWYDFHTNPKNREVTPLPVGAVRELFPGCVVDARRLTLAPPISRAVAPRWWLGSELLASLPFLRSHWAAFIRPGTPSGHVVAEVSH